MNKPKIVSYFSNLVIESALSSTITNQSKCHNNLKLITNDPNKCGESETIHKMSSEYANVKAGKCRTCQLDAYHLETRSPSFQLLSPSTLAQTAYYI